LLALFESERQHEAALQTTVLTENPTLKAALDTYQSEIALQRDDTRESQVLATVDHEVTKLAGLLQVDVVSVVGADGRVIASAGPRAAAWARQHVTLGDAVESTAFETVVSLGPQTFRTTVAPLQLGGEWIGNLVV